MADIIGPQACVFLVENPDSPACSDIGDVLSGCGYRVVSVPDVEHMAEFLQKDSPDLILLNLEVDESQGVLLVEHLLTSRDTPPPSILGLAAGVEQPEWFRSNSLADKGILKQPYDTEELVSAIKSALEAVRLRRELAQRNAELERLNQRMNQLLEMKNHFLKLSTHDIRTPITTMKLVSDVIEHQISDEVKQQIQKPLDVLARNIAKIETKINEFLLIGRLDINPEEFNFGPVDLKSVIESAIASFFPGAISRGIALDADLADVPRMKADANKISHMVCDLVACALDRLEQSQSLTVKTVSKSVDGCEGVEVSVACHGSDMRDGQAEEILNGLRMGNPSEATRATLYAAYQVSKLHGGRFNIMGGPGLDTKFIVWLPLEAKEKGVL